jgi:hypothetical protein
MLLPRSRARQERLLYQCQGIQHHGGEEAFEGSRVEQRKGHSMTIVWKQGCMNRDFDVFKNGKSEEVGGQQIRGKAKEGRGEAWHGKKVSKDT